MACICWPNQLFSDDYRKERMRVLSLVAGSCPIGIVQNGRVSPFSVKKKSKLLDWACAYGWRSSLVEEECCDWSNFAGLPEGCWCWQSGPLIACPAIVQAMLDSTLSTSALAREHAPIYTCPGALQHTCSAPGAVLATRAERVMQATNA